MINTGFGHRVDIHIYTNIDSVIYFSRTGNWGYITPPLKAPRKKLNSADQVKFHQYHGFRLHMVLNYIE